MKPVRGSERAASKAPEQKNKRKTAKKPAATKTQDEASGERRHEEEEEAVPRKANLKKKDVKEAKYKASWKPMSRASIAVLENIMDLSILATLSSRSKVKKEQHEHLNRIKNRFLDECKQLKVPVQKQQNFSQYHHQEESKKSVAGKKTLSTVKKDLSAVGSALEKMEEQTVSLQHDCSMLRNQVEEEEEKAKRILAITEDDVLSLPLSCSKEDETTLEMRVRRIMSDRDCEITAKRLAEVLQKSEVTRHDQVLLRQAHKYADQLFSD
ncbi:centromere protein Q isoform X2 [Salarias fasciatus]|uniref:Centromere protein Q n=1 Tax=Salarias fasciatus TaxID=181472 RepID=A0A672GXM1_SALFA|nr:centromere protein Q isoform X2 [Salarias fasciatus]